ncbi:hypothetical protein F4604DRAFT_1674279 [Suillus subluteus]|nr:hypothetical protein F4604DRAFT_1674279 [Suillus subluteus]
MATTATVHTFSHNFYLGAARLQCPYLANATWAVYQNDTVTIELPQMVTFICDDIDLTAASTGPKTTTYVEANLRSCSDERLRQLESWIEASRAKLNGKQYLLVVEPITVREKEIYPYYYVIPENHIITWVEPNHKRLKLEAQYWKHVEYFPHEITIPLSEVRALRIQLNWYHVGELAEPDGTMKGPGVAICGADLENSPFMAGAAVAMFWIPLMVLRCLKQIYVDGLVNGVDIRSFTDNFSAQAKAQTTVVYYLQGKMASLAIIAIWHFPSWDFLQAYLQLNSGYLYLQGSDVQISFRTWSSELIRLLNLDPTKPLDDFGFMTGVVLHDWPCTIDFKTRVPEVELRVMMQNYPEVV